MLVVVVALVVMEEAEDGGGCIRLFVLTYAPVLGSTMLAKMSCTLAMDDVMAEVMEDR